MVQPGGTSRGGSAPQVSLSVLQGVGVSRESLDGLWGALYQWYDPRVRSVFGQHGWSWDEVQDLSHDVWVEAVVSCRTLRNPSAFGSWLMTIARRVEAAHIAARVRHRERMEAYSRRQETQRDDLDRVIQMAHDHQILLSALSPAQRSYIELYLEKDLSAQEIADALGYKNAGVAHAMRTWVLKTLRKKMGHVLADFDNRKGGG